MRIALTLLAVAAAAAALTAPLAFGGAAATQTVRVTETDYRISLSTKPTWSRWRCWSTSTWPWSL